MTTTITRQQLRDAIEAGIREAGERHATFTPEHATALRAVAEDAALVARGTYAAPYSGGRVLCPVGAAFPVWPDDEFAWLGTFTDAYDGATWRAVWREDQAAPGNVLQVTDNDGSTEGAA